jgi:hypothetical protein
MGKRAPADRDPVPLPRSGHARTYEWESCQPALVARNHARLTLGSQTRRNRVGRGPPGYNERLRWLDPLLLQHVARRVWSQAARFCGLQESAVFEGNALVEPAALSCRPQLPPQSLALTHVTVRRSHWCAVQDACKSIKMLMSGETTRPRLVVSPNRSAKILQQQRIHTPVRREFIAGETFHRLAAGIPFRAT